MKRDWKVTTKDGRGVVTELRGWKTVVKLLKDGSSVTVKNEEITINRIDRFFNWFK